MKTNELVPLQIEDKIIEIRNQKIILDRDVATHYGVETRDINKAVKNNPKKFPKGYVFELSKQEWYNQRALIATSNKKSNTSEHVVETFHQPFVSDGKSESLYSHVIPKAFTEKGLYMLATILKSERATKATIEIVEAFAKMRELSRNIAMLCETEPEVVEPEFVEKTGGLLTDMLFSHLPTTSSETSLEFNLGVMKGKKIIKSDNSVLQNKIDRIEKMIEKINKKLESL
jgi:phage regulator Rha-like protein